jgi:rubredoxin
MGTFNDAIDHERMCPACGAMDLPPPAAPTLEVLSNGTMLCGVCSHVWKPEP